MWRWESGGRECGDGECRGGEYEGGSLVSSPDPIYTAAGELHHYYVNSGHTRTLATCA